MSALPATAPVPPGAVVSPARRRFSLALVAATLFLVFAGAEVKSHEAGLAVPDWPLSYGMWMPPMVGNVFYEHGHRMVAATVGLLTVVLALWTWRRDPRPWVVRLAWFALAVVILQGVLGGITVLFLLPTAVSMSHAALAQTFLCLLVWLAYANSHEWNAASQAPAPPGGGRPGREQALAAALAAAGAVFIQLVLGAWMRHSEAGLAVPFFPVSRDGALLPEHVDRLVVIHMLHRGFALVVVALVLRACARASRVWPGLRASTRIIALLVGVQVLLGGAVVWTGKTPLITSLHVVAGAGLLAACWLLVLRVWRAARTVAGLVPRVSEAP